jgi:predicted  nucleic acid-binding Zn ribbon protein
MNKELEKDFEVLEKDLDTNSGEAEKDLNHILKLKCNYYVYRTEREKYKMPISQKCFKCNKNFKDNDKLYQIEYENGSKSKIMCEKCISKQS